MAGFAVLPVGFCLCGVYGSGPTYFVHRMIEDVAEKIRKVQEDLAAPMLEGQQEFEKLYGNNAGLNDVQRVLHMTGAPLLWGKFEEYGITSLEYMQMLKEDDLNKLILSFHKPKWESGLCYERCLNSKDSSDRRRALETLIDETRFITSGHSWPEEFVKNRGPFKYQLALRIVQTEEEPDVLGKALEALRNFYGIRMDAVEHEYRKVLDHQNPRARKEAISNLKFFPERAKIDASYTDPHGIANKLMEMALHDPEERVRYEATSFMRFSLISSDKFRAPCIDTCKQIIKKKFATSAVECLCKCDPQAMGEDGMELLFEVMQREDCESAKEAVAKFLGEVKDEDYLPARRAKALIAGLDDKDMDVAKACARGLGKMTPEAAKEAGAITALESKMASENPELSGLKKAAEAVLKKLQE